MKINEKHTGEQKVNERETRIKFSKRQILNSNGAKEKETEDRRNRHSVRLTNL